MVFVMLFVGASLARCSEVEDARDLLRKIDLLEREKRELSEQFAKANNDIGRLQEENQKLNTELAAARQKERDNLDRLFR